MSTSSTHTLILTEKGTIYGAGTNNFGQMPLKPEDYSNNLDYFTILNLDKISILEKIIRIFAFDGVSFILTDSGKLFSAGINSKSGFGRVFPSLQQISIKNIDEGTKITSVHAGNSFSYLKTSSGFFNFL